MRQRIVVANLDAHIGLVPERPGPEEFLVCRLACAQRHHRHIPVRQFCRNLLHQVEALLRNKPRHDPDHRRRILHAVQSKFTKKIGAALVLPGQVFRRVVRRQPAVRGRVPLRIVHAIQNAAQVSRAPAQHAVEAVAEFRRLNFPGIFAAHRGHNVRENQAALEEVEGVEMLHLVHGENVPGEQEALSRRRRKPSLVAAVVDSQHHARAAQHRVSVVDGAQVDGDGRRLPVVHMENIRHAKQLGGLKNRPRKQAEPLPVVGKFAVPGSIELESAKQLRAVHKIVLHAGALAAVHDAYETVVILEWDGDGADRVLPTLRETLARNLIEWQVYGYFVAQLHQFRGQSPHDVR